MALEKFPKSEQSARTTVITEAELDELHKLARALDGVFAILNSHPGTIEALSAALALCPVHDQLLDLVYKLDERFKKSGVQ